MITILEFYRQPLPNGATRSICLRCFEDIGVSDQISMVAELEASHVCHGKVPQPEAGNSATGVGQLNRWGEFFSCASRSCLMNRLLAIMGCLLFFYMLPTICEFLLMRLSGSWLTSLFFGNLCGCMAIGILQKKRAWAVSLYLALIAVDGVLYYRSGLSSAQFPWVLDIVPTLLLVVHVIRVSRTRRSQTLSA
ncbi:hypothetical protein [Acidipila rosea]|uniref:Uncharacterized protein n=1 Tax=Acidipila rosea TaxID=768535 RepID=A0A4R1L698_9BACT|nr:hypothetical protein [Acidipila rosea]TCK73692.1 hypothetical protein C7378_1305 [Acidipila rosea]